MKVQLLFFQGCPNVDRARAVLRRSLQAEGMAPVFDEIDILAAGAESELAGWGSPTILLDGRDAAGAERSDAPHCRLYGDSGGVPSEAVIRAALRSPHRRT